MAGKKDKGVEVDFFGDSVDWLSDEEAVARPPEAPPAPPVPERPAPPAAERPAPPAAERRAPAGPPPPPPDLRSAVPSPAAAGETGFPSRPDVARDPRSLSNAPTLIFSTVPTLPPQDSPFAKLNQVDGAAPVAAAPLRPLPADARTEPDADADTVEVTRSGLPDAGDRPTGPTEMIGETGPAHIAGDPVPSEERPRTEEIEGPTEQAEREPEPVRVMVAGGATPGPTVRASATPAGVPRLQHPTSPSLPPMRPPSGEGGWPEVLRVLRAELEAAPREERGPMATVAGLVALRLAAVPAEAESWFAEAHALGEASPELLRLWAEARGALGRWSDQEATLLELAARSEEPDRAEVRLEAALVAWRRRQRPDEAVRHLGLAAEGLPDDYTSRALLRALLPSMGKDALERRLALLDEIAALAEGGITADALVERATVAEELGRPDLARASLERALQAEPGHTFAFQRLERQLAGDAEALAALYEREATREGQPDAGWWWTRAARVVEQADPRRSIAALKRAAEHGWTCAQRDLNGLYLRVGDDEALEASLREQATEGPARAWAAFRAGWLAERSGRLEAAAEAYRLTLQADPGAAPAVDAVARLTRRQGKEDLAPWQARLEAATDAEERRALQLRIAELALVRGASAEARPLLEAAASVAADGPEREVALDLLDLALAVEGDEAALAAHRRSRADSTAEGSEPIDWLLLAATTSAAPEACLPPLLTLLDLAPEHRAGLALAAAAFTRTGRQLELAERLRTAADATVDAVRRAALLYRAARVLADHGGDEALARQLAERAVATDPRLRLARWLTRALVGPESAAAEAADYRAAAGRDPAGRRWALFAAAVLEPDATEARADLERLLAEEPDHAGASALLETLLAAGSDRDALLDLRHSATADESGQELLRDAADLVDAGRTEEAILVLRRLKALPPGAGVPARPAARLAVALGIVDLGIELLSASESAEDRTERARLLAGAGRYADALPLLEALAADGPDRVGVAARLATVAQQTGSSDVMIGAYATLATEPASASLRAAYSAWTAMQMQAAGRDADALPMWRAALAERPTSTTALAGAVRSLVARRDPDGIRKLFAMLRPESPELLAEALRFVGDRGGAADVLSRTQGESVGQRVASALRIERLREEVAHLAPPQHATAAWQTVYDAISARRELCRTELGRADADARRRWLLAEKLASTELAWDMYRKLHQESPLDREVTEALARIAAARGEQAMAVGYLRELADTAPTSERAAHYRCRVGEVLEGTGDRDGARQAYLDALDHVPGDATALRGLRRLAEQTNDWPGVVAVLQREAGTAPHERQVELRREIARITEAHLSEPGVAVDAWRGVLDVQPGDPEALRHLVDLSAAQGVWGTFVEAATALLPSLEGREKLELLRRIGVACLDHLGREDGLQYLEQAVAADPPDLAAAVRLEQHARTRADWAGVVRAQLLQAKAHTEPAKRVEMMVRAARLQLEAVHDKAAAAATYEQVLALNPDQEVALRFMASYLYESERFAEALPVCERLEPRVEHGQDLDDFDTRMELASFYFYFAEILRRAGREEEAIGRYERTLSFNPAHLPSLEAVGPLYVAGEHWSKAENVYRQLVQTGGQGDKARVAQLYTQLGLVERRLGGLEKAYKRFSKALELQANHVGALKGMALVLEDRQDWSNLLTVYNTIIYNATAPEDVIDAYMTKGRVLDEQMQRQDKAAQHYQRSLDFDPNQPHAYLRLAELALRRDDPKEAGDLVDKALRLDQDVVQPYRARLLVVRAASWQHASRPQEADRCLREARMLDAALVDGLGQTPLADLERLRRVVKDSLGA